MAFGTGVILCLISGVAGLVAETWMGIFVAVNLGLLGIPLVFDETEISVNQLTPRQG